MERKYVKKINIPLTQKEVDNLEDLHKVLSLSKSTIIRVLINNAAHKCFVEQEYPTLNY